MSGMWWPILLLLQVPPLLAYPCPALPLATLWSKDPLSSGRGKVGTYCHGLLLHSQYLLLPAHCLVARRKLSSSLLRIRLPSGRRLHRPLEPELVYPHPEFLVESYSRREGLLHDIAVIRLRRRVAGVGPGPRLAKKGRSLHGASLLAGGGSKVLVVGQHKCNRSGLGPAQLCLWNNASTSMSLTAELGLDPREGYYRQACWHLAGAPFFLPSCTVAALLLAPGCGGGGVALSLAPYSSWLQATITTDLLRTGGWRASRTLRKLFRRDVKRAEVCPELDSRRVYRDKEEGRGPGRSESEGPKWEELGPSLAVVTQCGVEVRLRSGIIHSPVHYRDVTTAAELGELLQDRRYK